MPQLWFGCVYVLVGGGGFLTPAHPSAYCSQNGITYLQVRNVELVIDGKLVLFGGDIVEHVPGLLARLISRG